MRIRTAFTALAALMLLVSCGDTGRRGADEHGGTDSLYAGKGIFIELALPVEVQTDPALHGEGPPGALLLNSDILTARLSAMIVPGAGSSPEDRVAYLDARGVDNLDTARVRPHEGIPAFTAAVYNSGDSSVVERVWNRGGGELLVLRASAANTSLSILLASVGGILGGAEPSGPSGGLYRPVYLSDRTREEIVADINADVGVPARVFHDIDLFVDPKERSVRVIDTVTIDFRTTLADSQMLMYIPDHGTGSGFLPLAGSVHDRGDSVICRADSTRIFSGLYTGGWTGSSASAVDGTMVKGLHLNSSISFQGGMWFYPGCSAPAVYSLRMTVPDDGYEVYVPLQETSREAVDTLLTVSYASPIGGVRGPLSWTAGRFNTQYVSAGRSLFLYPRFEPGSGSSADLAGGIADLFWQLMGYDGARFDIAVVRRLDSNVFITGPGCVLLTRDMLDHLRLSDGWAAPVSAGVQTVGAALAFEAARSFLAGSTYLDDNLRDALSAWAVCRFLLSGDPGSAALLRNALRKHYLYSTWIDGATEYSIADPLLYGSELSDPVILSKAPLVIDFLCDEVPAFEASIPRMLGTLRHSGDSYGRFFSALGIRESTPYGEMFSMWFYSPGVPLLDVEWSESEGMLEVRVTQHQPGQDFPLGSIMDEVTVYTETGPHRLRLVQGPTSGVYTADLAGITQWVSTIDLDPDRMLPADVVYRRSGRHPGGSR